MAEPPHRRVVLVIPHEKRDDAVALAEAVATLGALAGAGHDVRDMPESGEALARRLREERAEERIACSDYRAFFASLPRAEQDAVGSRWGAPERDPAFRPGELDCGTLAVNAIRCGDVAVAVTPPCGDDVDAPPHAVLAVRAWIADGLRADAVVEIGAAKAAAHE